MLSLGCCRAADSRASTALAKSPLKKESELTKLSKKKKPRKRVERKVKKQENIK